MFTLKHFIWLGISTFIISLMTFISIHFKFSQRKAINTMSIVALVSEITKIMVHVELVGANAITGSSGGGYIGARFLPFHLCSLFIFVFFYLSLKPNSKYKDLLINFFVPIGLVGASIALLLATSGVSFTDPEVYQCFIYHSFMVWLALYFIITKQVNLTLKVYFRNLIIITSLGFIMIWVNGALQAYDTNFFFVVRPPSNNLPYLTLKYGWHVYFIHLMLATYILETLISLPYIIKERKQKKASTSTA